jgi:SAM-dependent methyltransferase
MMSRSPADIASEYDARYAAPSARAGGVRDTRYAAGLLELLDKIGLVELQRLRTCVDLGCGLGFKTKGIARHFTHTVGLDLSRQAIQSAKTLHASEPIDFQIGNASDANLGHRFDFVCMFGLSLLNIPEGEEFARVVRELAERYLDPKGYLLVVGQTDFSGRTKDGWFCQSDDQLEAIASILGAVLYIPRRDLRNYMGRRAIREFGRRVLKRRADYCIVLAGEGKTRSSR